MPIKTSVKVISLYDLIANNLIIIFATLHHIIILVFNWYSIEYIDQMILDFPEKYDTFQKIQFDLEICNIITLFTIIILYLLPKIIYIFGKMHKVSLEQTMVIIMIISFIIKMLSTLNHLYHDYDKDFQKIVYAELKFLQVIELSYMLRFLLIVATIIMLLCLSVTLCLDKTIPLIQDFAKKYKITYTERIEMVNLHDV